MFKDYVYIGTSDEIQNFDIIMSYKEYFNHYNPFVSSYIPSKLSSGFTFRNKSIDKDYFDDIYSTRLNDLYLSPKIILPKIIFLETYGYYELNKDIDLLICGGKIESKYDEAIMLIFPPKKFIFNHKGCTLIFKLDDRELKIDTTYFSNDFYTFIIYDKIDLIIESDNNNLQVIFKTTIRYNENMIIEI